MAPNDTAKHPTMSPSLGRASPVTTDRVGPDDVLFGRGTGPNTNPGNKVFRSIILGRAADYSSAKTRVERRVVVQRTMTAIGQTKIRFLRKINGGCQAHLAINKLKKKDNPASSNSGDLFEIISDPEAIRQKIKLALRYAGAGDGKNEKEKKLGRNAAESKPKAAVANEQTLNNNEAEATLPARQMLAQQIDAFDRQRAMILPAQVDRTEIAEQPRPNPMWRPVLSSPSPQMSPPPRNNHVGVNVPLLLPSFPIAMPFTAMPRQPSSLLGLDSSSRAFQELACLMSLNHNRSFPERRRLQEEQSAMAALLEQRALNQLQAERTAFLESLVFDGHHHNDAMLRRGPWGGK